MNSEFDHPEAAGPDREAALKKVAVPAILLMVFGGLGLAFGVFGLVSGSGNSTAQLMEQFDSQVENAETEEEREALEAQRGLTEKFVKASQTSGPLANALGLVLSGLLLFGGLKLKKLESYPLALVGGIVALIPCTACCCFTMPVGVWVLIVVNSADVKASF